MEEKQKINTMQELDLNRLLDLQKLDSECDFLIYQLRKELDIYRTIVDSEFIYKYNISRKSKLSTVVALLNELHRLKQAKTNERD